MRLFLISSANAVEMFSGGFSCSWYTTVRTDAFGRVISTTESVAPPPYVPFGTSETLIHTEIDDPWGRVIGRETEVIRSTPFGTIVTVEQDFSRLPHVSSSVFIPPLSPSSGYAAAVGAAATPSSSWPSPSPSGHHQHHHHGHHHHHLAITNTIIMAITITFEPKSQSNEVGAVTDEFQGLIESLLFG